MQVKGGAMCTFNKSKTFGLHPFSVLLFPKEPSQPIVFKRSRNLSLKSQPAISIWDSKSFTLLTSRFSSFNIRSLNKSNFLTFDYISLWKLFARSLFSYSQLLQLETFMMDSSTNDHQTKKRCLNNPDVDNEIPTIDLMALANTQSKLLKSTPKNNIRIIVEGNIGSGKTTFLNTFSKNCSNRFDKPLIVPEPIDLWRDVGGENIFQLLSDDPKRWSFTFQSYVQLTMMKIHEMVPNQGCVKVMERSLYSARYCFVENLRNRDLLQPMEYHILDQWFQTATRSPSTDIDLIIYLRSDPDIVYERIKARARPEEAGLTLDYLRSLHELHEDWLVRAKYPVRARVLCIDANTPLDQIISVYEEKTDALLREHIAVMA